MLFKGVPSAAGPNQEQHRQKLSGRERQADDLPACEARNDDRADRVSGEHDSRQPRPQPEYQDHPSDKLDRSSRRYEQICPGNL